MDKTDRKYFAVALDHTPRGWRYGDPLTLWGSRRSTGAESRCFAGYTTYPDEAELYSIQDWEDSHYLPDRYKKCDEAVPLCIGFRKMYRNYETVLIDAAEYMRYCRGASLPRQRYNRPVIPPCTTHIVGHMETGFNNRNLNSDEFLREVQKDPVMTARYFHRYAFCPDCGTPIAWDDEVEV